MFSRLYRYFGLALVVKTHVELPCGGDEREEHVSVSVVLLAVGCVRVCVRVRAGGGCAELPNEK